MFLNQTTYLSLPDEPVVRMKELGAVQYAYLLLKKRLDIGMVHVNVCMSLRNQENGSNSR
jgi:hypothetical protein